MARISVASVCVALLASPSMGCDISLPLSEGMFADLNAPLAQLTGLPNNSGAFEYLNERYLDTVRVTHDGKTFAWTATDAARACAREEVGRSCRVIADSETRFGRITLSREDLGAVTSFRYRVLMVEGRRHVRLFARPAATRLIAACNLMQSVDSFRRTWMHR